MVFFFFFLLPSSFFLSPFILLPSSFILLFFFFSAKLTSFLKFRIGGFVVFLFPPPPPLPGSTNELVWAVAGVCVIFDENRMTQRFFVGHDGEVSCLAVHPDGLLCASGQIGRSNAKVCIWSGGSYSSLEKRKRRRGRGSEEGGQTRRGGGYRDRSSELEYPRYAPEVCPSLQLPIGSGVAALDFSPDGDFLLTIAMNMHHTMTMWDWRRRHPLCSVKTHSAPVYMCRFNPYQFHVEEETRERVYTAVTAGQHHVKVWTLR